MCCMKSKKKLCALWNYLYLSECCACVRVRVCVCVCICVCLCMCVEGVGEKSDLCCCCYKKRREGIWSKNVIAQLFVMSESTDSNLGNPLPPLKERILFGWCRFNLILHRDFLWEIQPTELQQRSDITWAQWAGYHFHGSLTFFVASFFIGELLIISPFVHATIALSC